MDRKDSEATENHLENGTASRFAKKSEVSYAHCGVFNTETMLVLRLRTGFLMYWSNFSLIGWGTILISVTSSESLQLREVGMEEAAWDRNGLTLLDSRFPHRSWQLCQLFLVNRAATRYRPRRCRVAHQARRRKLRPLQWGKSESKDFQCYHISATTQIWWRSVHVVELLFFLREVLFFESLSRIWKFQLFSSKNQNSGSTSDKLLHPVKCQTPLPSLIWNHFPKKHSCSESILAS